MLPVRALRLLSVHGYAILIREAVTHIGHRPSLTRANLLSTATRRNKPGYEWPSCSCMYILYSSTMTSLGVEVCLVSRKRNTTNCNNKKLLLFINTRVFTRLTLTIHQHSSVHAINTNNCLCYIAVFRGQFQRTNIQNDILQAVKPKEYFQNQKVKNALENYFSTKFY